MLSNGNVYERNGNIEFVVKRNGNDLKIYMLLDGVKIGDMDMKYTKSLESYDELYSLQKTIIGEDLWGDKVMDNLGNINLKTPHILISWIGIRIDKEKRGYGKLLFSKGLNFAISTFPNIKWFYLYRFPKESAKLKHFYSQFDFIDTGFRGVMYKIM